MSEATAASSGTSKGTPRPGSGNLIAHQWKPGQSGNPRGRQPGLIRAICLAELASGNTLDVFRANLRHLLRDEMLTPADRIRLDILEFLRDTIDGRPKPIDDEAGRPPMIAQFFGAPMPPPQTLTLGQQGPDDDEGEPRAPAADPDGPTLARHTGGLGYVDDAALEGLR